MDVVNLTVDIRFIASIFFSCYRLRPYHVENSRSRPIPEFKQRLARSVFGWVTAWEYLVLKTSLLLLSFFFILLLCMLNACLNVCVGLHEMHFVKLLLKYLGNYYKICIAVEFVLRSTVLSAKHCQNECRPYVLRDVVGLCFLTMKSGLWHHHSRQRHFCQLCSHHGRERMCVRYASQSSVYHSVIITPVTQLK